MNILSALILNIEELLLPGGGVGDVELHFLGRTRSWSVPHVAQYLGAGRATYCVETATTSKPRLEVVSEKARDERGRRRRGDWDLDRTVIEFGVFVRARPGLVIRPHRNHRFTPFPPAFNPSSSLVVVKQGKP